MEFSLNIVQLIGIWLMVTGLVLNTIIFVFTYYKVANRLRKNEEENDNEEKEKGKKDDEEKPSFPLIRFIFHFRGILKDFTVKEKRENFEMVVSFLKWTLALALSLIVVGLIMFLVGFFF